jgi:capsid protein
MASSNIVKGLGKSVGTIAGKAGKTVLVSVNPLEVIREYVNYRRIVEEQKTERERIISERDRAVKALEAEKEVILDYFERRFKERKDVLSGLFDILHQGIVNKNDNVIDKALEGIVGIVKDNPLKDFETFRQARISGKTIEI